MYHTDNAGGQARSRSTGGPIVYGKVVHKAPAGSRLRNGTPNRMRSFEDVSHLYGKVNRQMPDPRRRQTSFRVGGGGSPSKVPQAGSFQHLQELVRLDRVRELQVCSKDSPLTPLTIITSTLLSIFLPLLSRPRHCTSP